MLRGRWLLEGKVRRLEARGRGVFFLSRVVFSSGLMGLGVEFREVRMLMAEDGGGGRLIRVLEPGEVVLGVVNPPWLRVGDDEVEDGPD